MVSFGIEKVELVHKELTISLGIQLTVVDARKRFLDKLARTVDSEQKRRTIGNEFISVFQEAARKIEEAAAKSRIWGRRCTLCILSKISYAESDSES